MKVKASGEAVASRGMQLFFRQVRWRYLRMDSCKELSLVKVSMSCVVVKSCGVLEAVGSSCASLHGSSPASGTVSKKGFHC